MFLTPAAVLFSWLRGLFSVLIVVGCVWLIASWYQALPIVKHRIVSTDNDLTTYTGTQDETRIRTLRPSERIAAWRPAFDRETAMLVGGLCLLLWSTMGRLLNPLRLFAAGTEPQPDMPPGEILHLKQLDGTEIHIEIRGRADAPTVVLTHGWSLSSSEWKYLQRHWGDKFRTVVWDLPGLGNSKQPSNRDFSLEKLARDLRVVIEASSTGSVILVGHSIGGMIILTFCRLFPELLGHRVSKLALVHTTYINPLRTMMFHGIFTALQKPLIEPLIYLQIALSPLVRLMNMMSYWNGSIHTTVALDGFGGKESRSTLDFIARYSLYDSPAVLARGTLGMLEYDATNTLSTIRIPVLVVAAENDPVTTADASRMIAAGIPSSRLLTLKNAKHYGLIEYDSEFASASADFFLS